MKASPLSPWQVKSMARAISMAGATENRTKAEAGRVTTIYLHCREEHRTSRRKHKYQEPGATSPGPIPSCSLSKFCPVPHCSPPTPHSLCSGPHPPGCLLSPCTAGLDHWWGCHHLPSYRGFQDTGAEREWERSAQIPPSSCSTSYLSDAS